MRSLIIAALLLVLAGCSPPPPESGPRGMVTQSRLPDYFLRLTFGPDNKLRDWVLSPVENGSLPPLKLFQSNHER